MSVTCPRISTLELAGHPARSINHSLFSAVVRTRPENGKPFTVRAAFSPVRDTIPRGTRPQAFSTQRIIHSSTAGPSQSRRRIATGSGTTTKKERRENPVVLRSFVPFVRYVSEQRQPGLLRARPGLMAICGALSVGQNRQDKNNPGQSRPGLSNMRERNYLLSIMPCRTLMIVGISDLSNKGRESLRTLLYFSLSETDKRSTSFAAVTE